MMQFTLNSAESAEVYKILKIQQNSLIRVNPTVTPSQNSRLGSALGLLEDQNVQFGTHVFGRCYGVILPCGLILGCTRIHD